MRMINSEEYKILQEITLDYGGVDQIWLFTVRINGVYAIEMNSRYSCLGRRIVKGAKSLGAAFDIIKEKFREQKNISSALFLANLAFNRYTVSETLFVIRTYQEEFDFNSLWKLRRQFKYTTLPGNEDLIFEDKGYEKKITVLFPGRKQPMGVFTPVSDDEYSKFRLHLFE